MKGENTHYQRTRRRYAEMKPSCTCGSSPDHATECGARVAWHRAHAEIFEEERQERQEQKAAEAALEAWLALSRPA